MDTFTRGVLQAAALTVGFGAIAMAVRLAWRVASDQHVFLRPSRAPRAAWQAIWVLVVVGGGLGFVGTALLISCAHQWSAKASFRAFNFMIGSTLLLLALVMYGRGGKYLSQAAAAHSRKQGRSQ